MQDQYGSYSFSVNVTEIRCCQLDHPSKMGSKITAMHSSIQDAAVIATVLEEVPRISIDIYASL